MADHDPLKQLQSLLEDRGKVLEKISSIQSALHAIKSAGLASGEPEPETTAPVEASARPLAGEGLYDSLLMTLRDIQAQIEKRVRPLAEEVVRAEEARLHEHYLQEYKDLEECMARIDQCILSCRDRIDEYEKRRAELARLNQHLLTLGSVPVPLPESLGPENIAAIITDRLSKLEQQGNS